LGGVFEMVTKILMNMTSWWRFHKLKDLRWGSYFNIENNCYWKFNLIKKNCMENMVQFVDTEKIIVERNIVKWRRFCKF
jgi:hypothetical protein